MASKAYMSHPGSKLGKSQLHMSRVPDDLLRENTKMAALPRPAHPLFD